MVWEASRSAILIEATFDGSAEHVVAFVVSGGLGAVGLELVDGALDGVALLVGSRARTWAAARRGGPDAAGWRSASSRPGRSRGGEQAQREHERFWTNAVWNESIV